LAKVVGGDGDRIGHQVIGTSVESGEGLIPWDLNELPGEGSRTRIGRRELNGDFGDDISLETNDLAVGIKELERSKGEVSTDFEMASSDYSSEGATGILLYGREREKARVFFASEDATSRAREPSGIDLIVLSTKEDSHERGVQSS